MAATVPALTLTAGVNAAHPDPATPHATVEIYDSFQRPGGNSMADYAQKWSNIYGPGEMALGDTRTFKGNAFNVSAVPFRTGADFSVFDHLKYIAISTKAFPVPADGRWRSARRSRQRHRAPNRVG